MIIFNTLKQSTVRDLKIINLLFRMFLIKKNIKLHIVILKINKIEWNSNKKCNFMKNMMRFLRNLKKNPNKKKIYLWEYLINSKIQHQNIIKLYNKYYLSHLINYNQVHLKINYNNKILINHKNKHLRYLLKLIYNKETSFNYNQITIYSIILLNNKIIHNKNKKLFLLKNLFHNNIKTFLHKIYH